MKLNVSRNEIKIYTEEKFLVLVICSYVCLLEKLATISNFLKLSMAMSRPCKNENCKFNMQLEFDKTCCLENKIKCKTGNRTELLKKLGTSKIKAHQRQKKL